MDIQRTEFVGLMLDRFSDDVYEKDNHEDIADFLYIINGPNQDSLEPKIITDDNDWDDE